MSASMIHDRRVKTIYVQMRESVMNFIQLDLPLTIRSSFCLSTASRNPVNFRAVPDSIYA